MFSHKPWLKRDYENKEYYMKLKYLIKHLNHYDKKKVKSPNHKWQNDKVQTIIKNLNEGVKAQNYDPIDLIIHETKEEFKVNDGISRIKAFKTKKIKKIKVDLRIGDW